MELWAHYIALQFNDSTNLYIHWIHRSPRNGSYTIFKKMYHGVVYCASEINFKQDKKADMKNVSRRNPPFTKKGTWNQHLCATRSEDFGGKINFSWYKHGFRIGFLTLNGLLYTLFIIWILNTVLYSIGCYFSVIIYGFLYTICSCIIRRHKN